VLLGPRLLSEPLLVLYARLFELVRRLLLNEGNLARAVHVF